MLKTLACVVNFKHESFILKEFYFTEVVLTNLYYKLASIESRLIFLTVAEDKINGEPEGYWCDW